MPDCDCPQCAALNHISRRETLLIWLNTFLLGCLATMTWWTLK